jgi:tetraacyldisaccharide 4'-kinase
VNVVQGADIEEAAVKGKSAVAVSAVGNPASFERLLADMGLDVAHHFKFRDHHAYRAAEVETIQRRAEACRADLIVTTEKDACKLVDLVGPDRVWLAMRLQARFRSGEAGVLAMLNERFS